MQEAYAPVHDSPSQRATSKKVICNIRYHLALHRCCARHPVMACNQLGSSVQLPALFPTLVAPLPTSAHLAVLVCTYWHVCVCVPVLRNYGASTHIAVLHGESKWRRPLRTKYSRHDPCGVAGRNQVLPRHGGRLGDGASGHHMSQGSGQGHARAMPEEPNAKSDCIQWDHLDVGLVPSCAAGGNIYVQGCGGHWSRWSRDRV